MALSSLVICMIFSLAAQTANAFTCPAVGIYPDPTNCHNFYTCDETLTATQGTCMKGKGTYDASSQTCGVNTCSGPPAFVCPGVGLYIDPTNCTNFYSCDQYLVPIPGTCMRGSGSFDNVTKTCSASRCFNCVSLGFFADPDDCHSFYVCSENLVATHSTCTSAARFDPNRICVLGACAQATSTQFTCSGEGYFADPNDCKSYYFCDTDNTAYHGVCMGGGGFFDRQEEGCVVGKCSN